MNADLEQVFQLIEKGNALSDEKKYWEAATAYTQARRQLLSLASDADDATTQNIDLTTASSPTTTSAEASQIRELYKRQARDYLHRARATLLEALGQEDAADRALKLEEPTIHEQFTTATNSDKDKDNSSTDKSLERLRLFARLFANEQSLHDTKKETATTAVPTQEQESSSDCAISLHFCC